MASGSPFMTYVDLKDYSVPQITGDIEAFFGLVMLLLHINTSKLKIWLPHTPSGSLCLSQNKRTRPFGSSLLLWIM